MLFFAGRFSYVFFFINKVTPSGLDEKYFQASLYQTSDSILIHNEGDVNNNTSAYVSDIGMARNKPAAASSQSDQQSDINKRMMDMVKKYRVIDEQRRSEISSLKEENFKLKEEFLQMKSELENQIECLNRQVRFF